MKAKHELLENDWLEAQYMTRHMWADSFLRGHYFGGSRATGRCESMNAFLKKDLEEDIPLWMFLRHCDNGLAALRYHDMREDFRTNMTEAVLDRTNMELLEEQACSIFTREIFHRVRAQILRADKYIVLERTELPNYDVCVVTKYMRNDSKRKVLYSHDGDDVRCECYWYETKGIPCRHIFSVMKHLNKADFPEYLVKRRWLRDAKIIDPSSVGSERKCPHPDVVENTRYGGISTQSNLVAFYATKSSKAFNMAMKAMTGLVVELQKMAKEKGDDPISRDQNSATLGIKDPAIVPTKGRPTQSSQRGKRKSTTTIKPRYCKRCHGTGHDSRNCPTNGGGTKSNKN